MMAEFNIVIMLALSKNGHFLELAPQSYKLLNMLSIYQILGHRVFILVNNG